MLKDYINNNKKGIKFTITKELSDLKWSFTLWDVDEKEIYSTDKTNVKYAVESSMGKHQLTIKLKNLSLLPGKYLLSGEIRDGAGLLYAGYSNKRPFEIIADNDYRGSGVVEIEHEIVANK